MRARKRVIDYWQLYLMLLIPVLFVIIFRYVPMSGLQIAFRNYDLRYGIWKSPFVGLKCFIRFFRSYQFLTVLTNTLVLSFYSLGASFPLPIIFALILNALPFKPLCKVVQTITYIPHFLTTTVIVGILMQLFNNRMGIFPNLYYILIGKTLPDLFASPSAFRHLYVWSGVWQGLGWNSIIYFATLTNVDPALNEAAQIDGASRFQRVIHIDFPCLLPTASILLIMAAGRVMNVGFEKVYLMQNNLNISSSEVISTHVYKVGMITGGGDFSFATAIGMFNSLTNFVLILSVNLVCRKLGGNSLW